MHALKRIIPVAIITIIAIFLVAINPIKTVFASTFSDIDSIAGREYIEKFAESGFINGYEDGTFQPNNYITRAEISQILANFNITLSFEETEFSDTDGWYKEAITKASENGFINGYEDGTFKPNNNITRYEMIKIVSMLVRNEDYDKVNLPYSDISSIPKWVLNHVNNLYASGVIDYYDNNTINGKEYITRSEAVIMLAKAFEVSDYDMNTITQNLKTNKINPLPTPTELPSGVVGYLTVSGTNIQNFPVKDALDNTEMLAVMKTAIGHFAQTPIFNGNVGLSGHNRDYDIDFRELKNVQIGDTVTYRTNFGTRTYTVVTKTEIDETDWSYFEDTTDNRITMVTCIEDQPTKRLIVQAVQQ